VKLSKGEREKEKEKRKKREGKNYKKERKESGPV
jgi:hypothetical protein